MTRLRTAGKVVTDNWLLRVVRSHPRTIGSAIAGLATWSLLPHSMDASTRAVLAWDTGALIMLVLCAVSFVRDGEEGVMAVNAQAQQEGEWTIFSLTLAGVVFSFVALTSELSQVKDMTRTMRELHIGLVAATLLLSWLSTHVIFALRYAHEFYTESDGRRPDGGLDFPKEPRPDYWDFLYFSLVIGMTFQVSDVDITSRKMRRLATVHGLIGFLFNTVIVALTANIAASLLG